jgi:hypothetical protein
MTEQLTPDQILIRKLTDKLHLTGTSCLSLVTRHSSLYSLPLDNGHHRINDNLKINIQ